MSYLWRYGEAAAVFLALFVGIVAAASIEAGELGMAVLVIGFPIATALGMQALKRWLWDGTEGLCKECGETIPDYKVYCSDCDNTSPPPIP